MSDPLQYSTTLFWTDDPLKRRYARKIRKHRGQMTRTAATVHAFNAKLNFLIFLIIQSILRFNLLILFHIPGDAENIQCLFVLHLFLTGHNARKRVSFTQVEKLRQSGCRGDQQQYSA